MQVTFAATLSNASLGPLHPFLAECWDPQGGFLHDALIKLQQTVKVKVAFAVDGSEFDNPLSVQLLMPAELEALMGETVMSTAQTVDTPRWICYV